ncbi:hypothetical protein [Aridibaculum aurantiacum]|uniref:hypothetical protein n=1 Tax=Aridibaculum aurantiacum TaxID=2810307 RepID=UPI001A96E807|nr:hypothetical protein [Aridibaculum aurantiacum]
MLSAEEEKFMAYWEANRVKEKSLFKQLSFGLPIGLLMGVGIILNFATGWYTRANMVANSQSTPIVLLVAVIIIALFCSVFYKRHKWDLNEQRYNELTHKQNKFTKAMQQHEASDSQA